MFKVLKILDKSKSTYGKFFRETKVSHTTLQRVLHYLTDKKFINKTEKGYEINNRGKILLEKLNEINYLVQ